MSRHSTTTAPRKRVALFVTCMVDTLYPEVGLAAVKLLRRHGADVVFPEEQTCCGQPAFNAGYRDDARNMARHFLDVFAPLIERGEVHAVVAPSGSCVAMVKHYYEVLLASEHEAPERERARRLSQATYELTQYLVDVLGVRVTGRCSPKTLAYHPCCHLLRELQVDAQPRQLLGNLVNAEIVDLPGAEDCCGFGGLFAVKNPELSSAMGQRKIANFLDSGADALVMNDVSCLTHLNGLLERGGHQRRACHIAEVLTDADDH